MQDTYIGRLEAALKQINDIQSRCEEAVRNVNEIMTEFKEMETKSAKEKTSFVDVISSMKEIMAEFKEEKRRLLRLQERIHIIKDRWRSSGNRCQPVPVIGSFYTS